MASSSISLYISQVAPLIGLDDYNNFHKVYCDIWKKYDLEDFKSFETRLTKEGHSLVNTTDMNNITNYDAKLGTNIKEQINEILQNKSKTSNELTTLQNNITSYINNQSQLSQSEKKDLNSKMQSITNKSHGVNNEDAVLKQFCALTEKTLVKEQGYIDISLVTTQTGVNWKVVGKYDGITADNELVEAKMRQKGLFKKMRNYENVQVQLYLYGLGFENGYLVEGFSKKAGDDLQIYIHEVKYDMEYVEKYILERLKSFVKFFLDIKDDTDKKIKLLTGDTSIYQYYVEHYLETLDF